MRTATATAPLRVVSAELRGLRVATRLPFRYGIAELREVVHAVLAVEVEGRGWRARGIAAENLAPRWFTKDPDASYDDELVDLRGTCAHAAGVAAELDESPSLEGLLAGLREAQGGWAAERGAPPLLANLGPALVERACLDALARGLETTFAALVRGDALGLDLGARHPELAGARARDLLPEAPRARVALRHTVGLSDALVRADLEEDPPADGLPCTLLETAQVGRLRWLKLKVGPDEARDTARLRRLASLLPALHPELALTLDGNEALRDVAALRERWERWGADERIAPLLARVAFLEQPLSRDVALADEVATALADWPGHPPLLADESAADAADARRALDLGYAGVSYKACKGALSGVANACLVEQRRRGGVDAFLSAEDLTTIGPIGVNQDLAVVATLGLDHVERNGHHYVRGLSPWPAPVQEAALAAHPDLYALHPAGFAALSVADGELSLESVAASPFGVAFDTAWTSGLAAL